MIEDSKQRVGGEQTRAEDDKGQNMHAISITERVQDQGNQTGNAQNEAYHRGGYVGDLGRSIITLFHVS
ncbi:MAG: hypothetical protein OQK50_04505 [Deltaproteobacteria bacterium]|nr:hypothetical protein [Deltaproteobacteria bacterium]